MSDCGHNHDPPQPAGYHPPLEQIAAVVLAAGRSRRMGRVKALLPLRQPFCRREGETVIERVTRLCNDAGLARTITVLGYHREKIEPLAARRGQIAVNPNPDEGMFSSVQTGLAVALQHQRPPAAVLLWPCDTPLVTMSTLQRLLLAGSPATGNPDLRWYRSHCLDSAPEQTGHPILMSRSLALHVVESNGTRLDQVLMESGALMHRVPTRDRGPFLDLDTPLDAAPYTTAAVLE